jgi:hypothetical protein
MARLIDLSAHIWSCSNSIGNVIVGLGWSNVIVLKPSPFLQLEQHYSVANKIKAVVALRGIYRFQ